MITIDIPAALWLSSNQRLHRAVEWQRTAAIRQLARAAAVKSRERYEIASCLARIGYPPRVSRVDPPNAWPAVKAGIDGCVDAGVLPDDSSQHIPTTAFPRGPRTKSGVYRVELIFTDQKVPF